MDQVATGLRVQVALSFTISIVHFILFFGHLYFNCRSVDWWPNENL